MPDYLQYHNVEKMGEFRRDPGAGFWILTAKPTAASLHNRVWLIEGSGKPRDYRLRATFVVDEVGPGAKGFAYAARGGHGYEFKDGLLLNDEHWFRDLWQKHGRFAYGFQPLSHEHTEQLRALARTHGADIT